MVPSDRKGEKLTRKFRKSIKYDYVSVGKVQYNAMHNKSVYEVGYLDVTTEKLTDSIIAGNMLS